MVLAITLSNGETLLATVEHPLYLEGLGFREAAQAGIGTSIVTRAGPSFKIVNAEQREGEIAVYNFSVADSATYFVGKDALWVHNCDIQELVDNVHGELHPDAAKRRTTGAVIVDDNGQKRVLVAGNGKYLTKKQQAEVARNGGEYVRGVGGHAETNLLNHAEKCGLKVDSIAASRPVCQNCAKEIRSRGGIEIVSGVKGE